MPNKESATRLSANILNYFAAFTETRFNFRTLINYRWTDNELTLDLGIFQEFQDQLLQRIKSGDSTSLTVRNNEHILSLSGDDVLLEIHKALSDKFGLEYLKSCVEQEIQKVAKRDVVFIATEKGLRAADNTDLSKQEIEKQNLQTFLDGCRKYNLSLRKQIETILIELQRKQIDRLKYELGIENVPASTFNPANYLKKHFDTLQSIARDMVFEDNLIITWRGLVTSYMQKAEKPFRVDPHTLLRNDAPPEYRVFREAAINLLIHQDYASHGFKAVIKFYRNLIQFWNPGDVFGNADLLLEPGEKEVRNPQIVAAFRRLGLCEQAGTGIRMVLNQWQALGHLEPEYDNDRSRKTFEIRLPLAKEPVTEQVTGEVGTKLVLSRHQVNILHDCYESSKLVDLMAVTGRSDRTKFRHQVLNPLLDAGLVEMTIPDKPRSSKQKYRLTDKGKEWVIQNQEKK